ncbi:DUF5987 family protein [Micromonospora sp. NPDC048871]|uniref:DUF5987 family protein n=1 Tax=unclassified Micromonospora TaxID=2617518 RepID=UPI002E152280|nr:DUF5987 family protein [Micromonospora sp. NBC_01739]
MQPDNSERDPERTQVLEAFADTIIPGEKRFPGDRTVAGVAAGGGAVAAGAIELLEDPAGGLAEGLDSLAFALNEHAGQYASDHGLTLDPTVPPFVALSFEHRTALVSILTRPDHPEKQMWVGLALFSNMAFDSAAHLSTPEALAAGHPGLLTIGYELPQEDGIWRFDSFSYGRELADLHPDTTATGSPA